MNHKLLFLLLSILLVAGCSSEGRRLKTESGYEYEIVRKGSETPIAVNDYIFFNMSLTADDSLLQSTASMGKPSVLKLTEDTKNYGQLKPLIDLMATLHEGDSLLFYFPLDSLDTRPPAFDSLKGPLIYHVGIKDIMNEAEFEVHADSIQQEQEAVRKIVRDRLPEVEKFTKATYDAYKKGELTAQMQTTSSGLRYIIHEQGDGPRPSQGDQVSVHYYGMLDSDATMFDSSFKGGQPYQFPVGTAQVVRGWDEAVLLMNKGTKATLFIPASLAWGAAGSPPLIPENADVIFYIEIEK
ncbi:MAG TPA: FKBP-type peptidyl-prolyl cis-trans isomerase [Saprospiraceae bacterium]|nr:FKBP-type peptidyl-prolyl cis-trans isomerase [Saprospiraceae bacterium]